MSIKNCIFYLFAVFSLIVITLGVINVNRKKASFVLLTDFGNDFAVGSIKGVILSQLPNATVTDLDHSIEKFNIISGGFALAKTYSYFPNGTIFVCVIDPGVGTQRKPICIQTPNYSFIGPDNGIFDFVFEREKDIIVYEIKKDAYLKADANTFHGRDLFAPAAVDLYKGNVEHFKTLDPEQLIHVIASDQIIAAYIDSFGNIKTNKEINSLPQGSFITVEIHGKMYHIPFVKTFNDVPSHQLLCYKGSNSTLEIAVNQGSASKDLGIRVGDIIAIKE